ncbi:MAG: HEAT repeat domain-containing protein [Nitrospiraceae bacterium]|nr:HEAT repeat domain-containing protein [Nitrospiraceae bacterium]
MRDTQRDFNLSRKCDGFWREEATAPGQGSGLSSLFDFQISEAPLPVPPHTPFMVKVSLKKDFNGTAKFYSCDKARFMLLDPTNAEFVENRTYNVHAKTGFIAKFPAEFLGDAVGSIPFVCAELSEAPAGSEKKYYAELLNIQILRLDKPEDWYSSHIMEALALDEPFAQARTKKLLTNYYPPEEVYSLLPGLAEWIARDENVPQAERAFKMIIGKYGGREAARALGAALKSPIAEARKKALELLTFCGQDGKESSAAINELLLNETDEEVLRDALLLAGNWRLEMPPKFHKQGEISPEQDAVYKQEIKDVCDHAAAVDLSQKEEYPRYYDDTGARIPEPPEATKAIASLESLIKKMPDYPEMARAYLLLGRLKKRFEDDYAETYNPTTHESGIPPEITNKMEEYIDGGPSGSYYYNGYHFNRLITLFPNSEYADDAAFEKTNLSQGGECEGDENCSLDYGVSPYVEFLNKYPSSDLADKAIAAINGEFKWILNEKSERIAGTEYFSISGLEATIASYQKAVQDVAPQNKANAEDVICSLWLKTGKKEKALAACSDVLKNYPSYPQAAEVKARIGKIQGEGFELKPPEVAGHLLVELRWEPVKNSKGYSVYRSTEGTENFELLGSASAEPVYQDRTIAPATNYAYYIKADSGDGAVLLSNRVVAEVPGRRQGANFVFYNDDERALNILGYVSNAQHEGLPNLMRISDDGKVESQVAGSFYGYFKSALDKYADGVMLVDPVHGKYLSFPSEQAFENNIQIVRKQDQEINPYPQGKWWPRPGRNIISIRKDNKGVWLAGRDGDTWPQHDFLSWDAGNNICWEARGRVLVRYDSTASGHGTAVYPGESYYFMGIYPDERDGSIWAVGTQGNFYKVSRTGRVTNHLKMDPVTMINNVAFDMVNNYAWIINVNYNDPQKTKLKKISLSDGSVLAEVKPDEYTEPGEKHGNFSLFLSLDHKTGNLWVFNSDSGHVTILSPEGKTIKSVMVS